MKNKLEIKELLAATDGANGATWDDAALEDAADALIAGLAPHEFEGRPSDSTEMARFAGAWKEIRQERSEQDERE